MSANVRAAELGDLPELAALMREFYAESGLSLSADSATEAFEKLLGDPRLGRVWLVERDRYVAGYVVLTLGYSMEYGGLRGHVDDFFVRAPYRGQGLGAAALTEVSRSCTTLGVRALVAEVGRADDAARRV